MLIKRIVTDDPGEPFMSSFLNSKPIPGGLYATQSNWDYDSSTRQTTQSITIPDDPSFIDYV